MMDPKKCIETLTKKLFTNAMEQSNVISKIDTIENKDSVFEVLSMYSSEQEAYTVSEVLRMSSDQEDYSREDQMNDIHI